MTLVALLKITHITGLIIWMGGLIVLPSLFRGRMHFIERSEEMHDWHRLTRAMFVGVMSPAALVAIGSGAALIFAREVYTEWMALKFAMVGMLVMLHVWAGHVILSIFAEGRRYPRWRQGAATSLTILAASATLVLVLAKPDISLDVLPAELMQPSGLRSGVHSLVPTIVPMP